MPLSAEQLQTEVLGLPVEQRARLAEILIASLDEDLEIEHAWMIEAERRYEELRTGRVQGVPAEQVFAELDDLLR